MSLSLGEIYTGTKGTNLTSVFSIVMHLSVQSCVYKFVFGFPVAFCAEICVEISALSGSVCTALHRDRLQEHLQPSEAGGIFLHLE